MRARPGSWRGMAATPLAQFTLQLTVILIVTLVALSLVVATLIESYFFRETETELQASVSFHFASVFGTNVFTEALADDALPRYDRMVRLHFDVYEIVDARFYDRAGKIVFAYQPDLMGTPETGEFATFLRQTLAGDRVTRRLTTQLGPNSTERGEVMEVFAPIYSRGQVVGVALVHRNAERLLGDVRRMQITLSGLIALVGLGIFLSLRRSYRRSTETILAQAEKLELAFARLQASHESALTALIAALESRDRETEGHTQRVTRYSRAIAERLDLPAAELTALEQGALLHDIGKIGVPDAILHKPGPLDDAEWTEMRKHPLLGASIVRRIDFFADALPLVLHHHERFDGGGYPDRLQGDAIPLTARIFAVADAFDAMTSDRPYRRALPVETARAEISRCAGGQFDPAVVDAFLQFDDAELATLRQAGADSADPGRASAATAATAA